MMTLSNQQKAYEICLGVLYGDKAEENKGSWATEIAVRLVLAGLITPDATPAVVDAPQDEDAVRELYMIMCGETEICEEHWDAAERILAAGYRKHAPVESRKPTRSEIEAILSFSDDDYVEWTVESLTAAGFAADDPPAPEPSVHPKVLQILREAVGTGGDNSDEHMTTVYEYMTAFGWVLCNPELGINTIAAEPTPHD